ncbi:protein kinase [Aeoliella sp. ICT_H6.2]|uniref:Protein kinase n=1 Tax=Aeoliella straminimaris TaxID=2954799 RepID=A0A9X2F633_9BACT|nr:protein kinase [Aeoliella straminimaris]
MSDTSLRAQEIFLAAREKCTPGDVAACLDSACREDSALRQRVERLLDADAKAGDFLGGGSTNSGTVDLPAVTETVGDTIGPYKLLQQIGEGGMGIVYMAEQAEPIERRVALKIIKPGMDSRQVIARFEAERQALAMMDHPNIARALEAGMTDTGRPYFVMELVKGVPITEYCDNHQLSPQERLKLFVPVCQAVQHAHQKGIIHRDIKPSNVLVAHYDDVPVPKVIDFGVAKAIDQRLTEKTMFTEFGQVLGTFEYMSPEQARFNQWDVDTRTDIYSLGVLLYELLSGETPFDRQRLRSAAIDELMRIIREEDPPQPSTRLSKSLSLPTIASKRKTEPKELGCLLRGELDWIVMKALEKDRTRRYETANGLRMDIQRHLDGDPVIAAPPSTSYRLKKMVKRHRLSFGIAALIASFLVLGFLGAAFAAIRNDHLTQLALEAEKRADRAKQDAQRSQYNSDIPRANQLLQEDKPSQARMKLTAAPAKYRNWEWARLADLAWRRHNAPQKITAAPSSTTEFWALRPAVVATEFLPWDLPGGLYGGFFADNASVYFYYAREEIKRFSVAYGEEQARYTGRSETSITVALSPTGSKLASFPFSNAAIVYDVDSEDVVGRGRDDLELSPPWTCSWSPNEMYLVTGHMDGTLRVWDARSPTVDLLHKCKGHESNTVDIYFPPSGDSVWSASNDGTIQKWSLPEGERLATYRAPGEGKVAYQKISPSGKLAATLTADGHHYLWEIDSQEVTHQLPGDGEPFKGPQFPQCRFSKDESCLAVMTGDKGLNVYDVASGRLINEFDGHGVWLNSLDFSDDGTMLLTTSEDGRAKIWSCVPEQKADEFQAHDDVVYQMDIDASSSRILTGSYDTTASVWSLSDHRRLIEFTQHEAEIVAVDLHPDDRRAATLDAEGVLHVWDTVTGVSSISIDPESDDFASLISGAGGGLRSNVLNFPSVLSSGIFTPDGSRLVAFQRDAMRVFDVSTGKELLSLKGADACGWPVYSHDSKLVAILEMNAKSLGVWNIQTGKLESRLTHGKPLVMIDFSPVDHRIVTSAMGSEIIVWDADSGTKLHEMIDPAGNATSCSFSGDGRYILVGYADSKVRIWNTESGELLTTLAGHSQRIRGVSISPDGTRILTWAMDNKAMIWDLTSPQANQLLVLRDRKAKLIQAHWAPDGRDIVAAWSDGVVEVWHGATADDLATLTPDPKSVGRDFEKWRAEYMNRATH